MEESVAEIKKRFESADAERLSELEKAFADDGRKGVRAALKTAKKRLAKQAAETERLEGLYAFERTFLPDGSSGVIIGLDEVGRGSVAGPLAVGAVILNDYKHIDGLNDSKKLTAARREEIAQKIKENALFWTVNYIQPLDIDRNGMSASLRQAFAGALSQAEQEGWAIDVVLIDGNPLGIDKREVNVVKGDAKCASIAAASIVAKVERDALMKRAAADYPEYAFDENKGYASEQHIEAIKRLGISDFHRASFCKGFMQQSLF